MLSKGLTLSLIGPFLWKLYQNFSLVLQSLLHFVVVSVQLLVMVDSHHVLLVLPPVSWQLPLFRAVFSRIEEDTDKVACSGS